MKKIFKHTTIIVLALLPIFMVSNYVWAWGHGGPRCWPKVVIKLGTPFLPGHILVDFAEKFKEIIEARSWGTITVEIDAGNYSEEEVNLMCSAGEFDMQATGGEALEVYAPEYFFFNGPFVIIDYDHFLRVWDGFLGDEARALIEEYGNMLSFGTVSRGYRQMTSLIPINGPDEIVGLKLRLPGVPTWITVWGDGLEADVVSVPLPELYDALASGLAEASEGGLAQIYSFNLFEVQDYLTITNHLVGVGWVHINKTFFEGLRWYQKIMIWCAVKEACNWATQRMIDNEDNLLAELQALGMTVVIPDAEAIREKAEPVVEGLFATEWPVTTWEEVLAQ